MDWLDILHICQQQQLPDGLNQAFMKTVQSCDKAFLLTCLLSAAQYGNFQAVSIINKAVGERTYNTKHTALSIAIEFRQKAVVKALIPTEAHMSKLTASMIKVIMGYQLDDVIVRLMTSKQALFQVLTEKDIVNRTITEYCILFQRYTLLEKIIEAIVHFNMTSDFLCDARHEPIIFLTIRINDLRSFQILYGFCLLYGLNRSISNQNFQSFAISMGAWSIVRWLSKQGKAPSILEADLSYRMQSTKEVAQIDHDNSFNETSLGEQYTSLSFLSCATVGTETRCTMLKQDSHKLYKPTMPYYFKTSKSVEWFAELGTDPVLHDHVQSLLAGNQMIMNILKMNYYASTINQPGKPVLAEVTAMKVCGFLPIFSLSIIIKPPGTVMVQDDLLHDEEILGLTPFSNPGLFGRFNPLSYEAAMEAVDWFLSVSDIEINKLTVLNTVVEHSNQFITTIPIRSGVDLIKHNQAHYFQEPSLKSTVCRAQDGCSVVLVDPTDPIDNGFSHMKNRYMGIDIKVVMKILEKHTNRDALLSTGWAWNDGQTLCYKHAMSHKLRFCKKLPVCCYASIIQTLRSSYLKIVRRQKV